MISKINFANAQIRLTQQKAKSSNVSFGWDYKTLKDSGHMVLPEDLKLMSRSDQIEALEDMQREDTGTPTDKMIIAGKLRDLKEDLESPRGD